MYETLYAQGLYTRVRRFYGENRACVSEADFYGIFSRFVADFVKARQRWHSTLYMYHYRVFLPTSSGAGSMRVA